MPKPDQCEECSGRDDPCAGCLQRMLEDRLDEHYDRLVEDDLYG